MTENTELEPLGEDPWILGLFEYSHLPEHLQRISEPFYELAHDMAEFLPDNPAREKFLETLKIAKDWAVNSQVMKGK